MRAPFQVLVIPFRKHDERFEFCMLQRADDQAWQAVAGGGEDGDSPYSAAFREVEEELGLVAGVMAKLDTVSSIPKKYFAGSAVWGSSLYIIPEYAFAVDCTDQALELSDEHIDIAWSSFDVAQSLCTYDSNKTALWELNERLIHDDLIMIRR